MDRVVRGTAATISVTFYVDGVATNPSPDSATVGITRDDGTVVVAAGTAAAEAGTGKFSYALTPTHTASLDILTATWAATVGGVLQSVRTNVEIVGAHACSIAQLDTQLERGGTASTYSFDAKTTARDAATDAIEAEIGYPLAPRYRKEILNGTGSSLMLAGARRPITLISATADDTALTASEVGEVVLSAGGVLHRSDGNSWGAGSSHVTVTYEHGLRYTPADCQRAVAIVAASMLKDGPFDDRGYGVTDEGGAVRLLTAGVQGAAFSIPEVEAAVRRHRAPMIS